MYHNTQISIKIHNPHIYYYHTNTLQQTNNYHTQEQQTIHSVQVKHVCVKLYT